MDWKRQYADKLVTVAEGARLVTSGQKLWVGMFTSTPESRCEAARASLRALRAHCSRFSVGHRLIHSQTERCPSG